MKKQLIFLSLTLVSTAAINAKKTPAPQARSAAVMPLGNQSVDQLLKQHPTVVLDFCATWCTPCKALMPGLEELAQKNPQVKFVKVDIDQHDAVSKRYKVKSVPTLIVFKNGNEVKRRVGFKKDVLNTLLD